MIEKVNPCHPDKVADRIAGAIVDLAYKKSSNPKIAVEVLIGHGECNVIAESSEDIATYDVEKIVRRIAQDDNILVRFNCVPQDKHLADNQMGAVRCGDNGIFKGVPLTLEEEQMSAIALRLFKLFPSDGKFIKAEDKLIVCQSNADDEVIKKLYPGAIVNPLGPWTGGVNVDSGAANRKLGSDMAQSVTGGGLHGKDLSKADVSVNIYAFQKAQETGEVVQLFCAIGDTEIDGIPYAEIVERARKFITSLGGFEKFAEWGLIRP